MDEDNHDRDKAVSTTINDENAPPNKKRVIDNLPDGFLTLGKQHRSFVGTMRTRISSSVAVVVATVPTKGASAIAGPQHPRPPPPHSF